eukprot:gene37787-51009_t
MSIVYAMLMIKGVTSFGRFHQRALYTSVDGNFIIRANENVSELNNNIDQEIREFLDINYLQKDEAKRRGAQFDWKMKKWYTTKEKLHVFADLCAVATKRVYLEIPYEMKDEAKARGAKFDFNKKKWYTNASNKDKFSDICFSLKIEEDLALTVLEQDTQELQRSPQDSESSEDESISSFHKETVDESQLNLIIEMDGGDESDHGKRKNRRGILILDVETTGLPRGGDYSSCRLVQIAMLLCDA